MIVVTCGWKFTDIDALAAVIAYTELLNKQGRQAKAVLEGPFNESISVSVRRWDLKYSTSHNTQADDEFIVVDISEPDHFSKCVEMNRVIEVIDHHPGFEDYWQDRGVRVDIRKIGAACTQVFELWEEASMTKDMSETSARLLATGILDNTLNFKAVISTNADEVAYRKCMRLGNLSESWPEEYFSECQQSIGGDLEKSIRSDHKNLLLAGYSSRVDVGQLAVWDAVELLTRRDEIKRVFSDSEAWFMNIISIAEGKNYILSDKADIQLFLERILNVKFKNGLAHTDRLWLRKEIMQAAIDNSKSDN